MHKHFWVYLISLKCFCSVWYVFVPISKILERSWNHTHPLTDVPKSTPLDLTYAEIFLFLWVSLNLPLHRHPKGTDSRVFSRSWNTTMAIVRKIWKASRNRHHLWEERDNNIQLFSCREHYLSPNAAWRGKQKKKQKLVFFSWRHELNGSKSLFPFFAPVKALHLYPWNKWIKTQKI